jgi:peptide/nickel transport system permease protein
VRDKRALVSATFLLLLLIAVAAGGFFARDPFQQDLFATLKPPLFRSEAGQLYLLGTDQLGRDLLSRLLYGARISLGIGGAAVLIAAVLGTTLGLLAGYFGGLIDALITGLTETILALPFIVLAIAVIGALGSNLSVVVLTLGLTGWVSFAKLVRGRVLELRQEEYVLSAVALGGSDSRALFKHILPNVFPLIIVDATLQLGALILAEAGLSFLGLGIQPPTPTWGGILSEGQAFVAVAWWIPTFPGLLLLLTSLSVNFLGDFSRDLLARGG